MKKIISCLLVLTTVFLFALPVWAADDVDTGSGAADAPAASLPSGNSLSPNIVVSKFSIGGDAVTAGRNFTLTYTLYNTNKNISIQNAMVKINGGETFSLAKDSDTFYIERIKAKGAVEHSSTFTSSVQCNPGSYPIALSITFEYYDDGTKYTGASELSISVPVVQDERVQITKAAIGDDDEPVYVGEEYGVDYSFINTGFSKLLNTELQLYNADNGEYITSAYLGTVNPSAEMSGSSYLYATFGSTGQKNLRLVVSYEDQNTNTYTVEKEFSVNVEETPPPVVEEEMQGENNFLLWGVIIIVLIGAGVVTLIVLRRRKKKKQAEAELWDDDDDFDDDSEVAAVEEDKSGSPTAGEQDEDN